MGRLGVMLLILVVGGAILVPIVMALDLEPVPGDFDFAWNNQKIHVPVLWSLCASGSLALLYSFIKR